MNHAVGPVICKPNITAIAIFLPKVVIIPLLLKENFCKFVLPVIAEYRLFATVTL